MKFFFVQQNSHLHCAIYDFPVVHHFANGLKKKLYDVTDIHTICSLFTNLLPIFYFNDHFAGILKPMRKYVIVIAHQLLCYYIAFFCLN